MIGIITEVPLLSEPLMSMGPRHWSVYWITHTVTSIEARIWSTKMADNQHFRYINKLPCFKEIYGNWKRCLKAYSYTRKEHWTWSTNMAAMASKFNFECVIQYYTDQWAAHIDIGDIDCWRIHSARDPK